MTVAEEQGQIEQQQAEQFAAETPPMAGVESVRVELGEDHSGSPALWLIFRLKPDFHFDLDAARHLHEYAAVIQTKILHSGLKRFPYTRVEQAA